MNILQKKTKSGSILRLRGTFTSQKAFSFRGWPPTRGSAPGPRWGLCPQTPIIGSRSTCSPWDVPLPNNFSESAPAFLPGRGEIGSGLDWLVAELSNLFQGQTHPGPRPHTWSTLFHLDAAVHAQPVSTTVHLTSRHHLTVPRYRWNWFGGRAFSVGSPTTWNALSDDLLRDPSHSVGDFHQISVSSAIEMSH